MPDGYASVLLMSESYGMQSRRKKDLKIDEFSKILGISNEI